MYKLIVEREEEPSGEKKQINITKPVKIVLTLLDVVVASSVLMASSGTYIRYVFGFIKTSILDFVNMIF